MPLDLDFLTHIINVQWAGGAIFTAGLCTSNEDHTGSLTTMYNQMDSKESPQNWQTATVFGGLADVRAGAYGNPGEDKDKGINGITTFCLGGIITVLEPGFLWTAFIVTSVNGGRSWTKTHFHEHGFVQAMAYDKNKQKFYAQATANTAEGTDEQSYDVVTLESSDGMSWGTVLSVSFPVATEYISPLVLAACDDTYQDAGGHNCPGGVYGFDKDTRTMIAPHPDIYPWAFTGRPSGDQIQIRREDEDGNQTTQIRSIPGMESISSVTCADGIWQASGDDGADFTRGLIASSTDDGESWKVVFNNSERTSTIPVVLGAPDLSSGAG